MWRPVGIKSSFASAEVPFDTGIWMLALGVISCLSYPALAVAFLMTLALLVAKLMNFGMDKPQLDLRATDDSVETGEREIPMLQIDCLPWLHPQQTTVERALRRGGISSKTLLARAVVASITRHCVGCLTSDLGLGHSR